MESLSFNRLNAKLRKPRIAHRLTNRFYCISSGFTLRVPINGVMKPLFYNGFSIKLRGTKVADRLTNRFYCISSGPTLMVPVNGVMKPLFFNSLYDRQERRCMIRRVTMLFCGTFNLIEPREGSRLDKVSLCFSKCF